MGIINKIKVIYYKTFDIEKYWTTKGLRMGKNCYVYSTASFGSEPYLVTLGDHVRINHGVKFFTHDGGVWVLRGLAIRGGAEKKYLDADLFKPIKIGNNVHIGTNAIIMPGVEIGDNCIIGAGAIVTKSIPSDSIAVGVPARVIETIDEYLKKNEEQIVFTKNYSNLDKRKFLEEHFNRNIVN